MINFSEITMIPTNEYIRCGFGSKRELRMVDSDVQVKLNGNYLTTIPGGFYSDGMSFPMWQATWDDPWHYRYIAAALLHDWLLSQAVPKKYVDWLFEGALMAFDVPSLETWIFKNAVRMKK